MVRVEAGTPPTRSLTTSLRTLGPGDEAALDRFLKRHSDTSMFLRSNARATGLEDHGEPFQATYVAAFARDEVVAVVAHCWNGMVLVQAPERLDDLVLAATRASHRSVSGLSGPAEQVDAARQALGMAAAPLAKNSAERLYALATDQLVVPGPLATGAVVCRAPLQEELDLLTHWRIAFSVEALGLGRSSALERDARAEILRHQSDASQWVLLHDGTPVAYSAFNARLPDAVQVGGVWTPPELRRRGFARAVVAGAILDARRDGATRAVLFTDDVAAQRAYEAIGFQAAGYYGLVLFQGDGYRVKRIEPHRIRGLRARTRRGRVL